MKGLVVALHVVLLLERLRAVGARKRPLAKVDGADVVLEVIFARRDWINKWGHSMYVERTMATI